MSWVISTDSLHGPKATPILPLSLSMSSNRISSTVGSSRLSVPAGGPGPSFLPARAGERKGPAALARGRALGYRGRRHDARHRIRMVGAEPSRRRALPSPQPDPPLLAPLLRSARVHLAEDVARGRAGLRGAPLRSHPRLHPLRGRDRRPGDRDRGGALVHAMVPARGRAREIGRAHV